MERLRNNYIMPCLYGCQNPNVVSSGVGRPQVILGTTGQYYILASRLCCKACKRYWFADKPQWLNMLPQRFRNLLPAFLTHKKAICKTVMDELRRSGKSPNDMANQLSEVLHLKYERAHLAYLLSMQNVRDAEAGLYGQKTITGALRKDDTPAPFGGYGDTDGWYGVSVSAHYLVECLLHEYQRQEAALTQLLQGTFGQVFRSDHTRKVARKVTLSSGTMSSYAVMNENWMILSWVMLQSESDANPTKQHIREHCRTKEPHPRELVQRVEEVLHHFYLAKDPNNIFLFKPSMLKMWWIQRIHILRGCLSDELLKSFPFDQCLAQNKIRGPINSRDTEERFGLQYVKPGRRPVPLDFDKHKSRKTDLGDVEMQEESSSGILFSFPSQECLEDTSSAETPLAPEPKATPQTVIFHQFSTPSAVTVKEQTSEECLLDAGGRVFVLDHNRWTDPMRNAIDGLLAKHHGSKDLLTKVDAEYAAMVQSACTDPNSLLHSTTKQHISSETVSVPVRVLPPAPVNPPAKTVPEDVPLDQTALEKMVKDIVEKQQPVQQQQQQQQQALQRKQTRSCLACGQPKSRYMGDGSSIHFFYQGSDVKYFYCSKKVFDTYSAEGLTNPRMPFEDFAETPFFQRELEASKQRGAERKKVTEERSKRKSAVELPTGGLCRFCHLPMKQGLNSPHIHTGFTGVFFLYKAQGMSAEMSLGEFQQSPFYEAEKQRWIEEKKK
ncbi:hypothetical protein QQF64_023712 [Cirrhinus molitorella]|uniref:DUF6729 domain-containing protein n=1 Tax=Cirrhinus molitorella TaxID=172907 RepID=A0ABR3NJG0_9TELE